MSIDRPSNWWTPLIAAGVIATSACMDSPTSSLEDTGLGLETVEAPGDHAVAQGAKAGLPRDVRQWVRALRRETRHYRSFSEAASDGYVAQLSPCVDSPAGGMGYHYGNPALIDTELEALRPEILMYEPRPNGRLRFVGVEYIVPIAAWDEPHPPEVEGVELHKNEALGLWVLHVWTRRKNPTGVFQDFNPRVTCQFAPERQES